MTDRPPTETQQRVLDELKKGGYISASIMGGGWRLYTKGGRELGRVRHQTFDGLERRGLLCYRNHGYRATKTQPATRSQQ